MNDKEQFDFLYSQAEKIIVSLPEYQFRFSAALTVILGWLITSDSARSFIASNPTPLKFGAYAAVALLIVCHSIWLWRHYSEAQKAHRALIEFAEKSDLINPRLIRPFALHISLPITYMAVNLILSSSILIVVFLAKDVSVGG